ncbi:Hsp70 family protein [Aspergillus novofumigatus IBT 16806]|uniref:Actin-like ATPase domain-containing protein n=1 Tax=Aspergillus novofumigatus (strain IBT 16806) TaxID=1392255 RepID=A0A2I1CGX9_ASPN1|nr:actin-like ATPase domain-containing protein [Aspergillus novofumigatus IBT 16806]PKX96886.1 actin-like ATPase domain-containing protein [Aspergillus novofumigatus IBT 16806]
MNPKGKFVVGVDYGTTFTGVSYAFLGEASLPIIRLVRSWPAPYGHTTGTEVPSRIAYPQGNCAIQKHSADITKFSDRALGAATAMGIMKLPHGKIAIQVVTEFLRELYVHICRELEKDLVNRRPPLRLRDVHMEFWFTTPAVWSDQIRFEYKEAAIRAGFGPSDDRPDDTIYTLCEPEAAALAAFETMPLCGPGMQIKPGDGVLICDCGDGTVDVTSYLISEVSPQLSFDELTSAVGGMCGATAIDRNFYLLMSERFGAAFKDLPFTQKAPGSRFMDFFQAIKEEFCCSAVDRVYRLPLSMALNNPNPTFFDAENRLVLLSSNDLRGIFDPVLRQIESANQEIGRFIINKIVLVGGFSQSPYLRERISGTFAVEGKLAILAPADPQAMVMRGAAIRGLGGPQPTTRKCRSHYGFERSVSVKGTGTVTGFASWVLAKGERYARNHTATQDLIVTHRAGDSLMKISNLYGCNDANAPQRVDHPGVYVIAQLMCDFASVDLAQFPQSRTGTQVEYLLEYSIEVTFGARGDLKCKAVCQGRTVGETTVHFAREQW